MPYTVNLRENQAVPERFDVTWTPTVLVLDPEGTERHRIEGYMPNREFRAQLEMGLARAAFKAGRFDEAEQRYGHVVSAYSDTPAAAEALYWRGVSHYKGTNEGAALGEVARQLKEQYPESEWAKKAVVWSA